MKKTLIILIIISLCFTVIGCETKTTEAAESKVEEEILNAHAIAIQFILNGYDEDVRLYTSQMENTNNDGKIAFLIEAEGETDFIHNLFIVAVKDGKAELIEQLI